MSGISHTILLIHRPECGQENQNTFKSMMSVRNIPRLNNNFALTHLKGTGPHLVWQTRWIKTWSASLSTCSVPWVFLKDCGTIFHAESILCCSIDNMARSHLFLLNNIFKERTSSNIKFPSASPAGTKEKENKNNCRVSLCVGFYVRVIFSLVHEKNKSHTEMRSTGQRVSSS